MKKRNGDETAPSISMQSTTGPQTTNVSENGDSGNTLIVQNVGTSTGDASQQLRNPAPTADVAIYASQSPGSSGMTFQSNSNVSTVTLNYANQVNREQNYLN